MSTIKLPRYSDDNFLKLYSDAWSARDAEVISSVFGEQGEYVESAYNNRYKGRTSIARFGRFMLSFSSDTKILYTRGVGNDKEFALEWMWTGTADGPIAINGKVYEPSQKTYRVPGVAWCRTNPEGQIVYHCDYYDLFTLINQIGLDVKLG